MDAGGARKAKAPNYKFFSLQIVAGSLWHN
jgi:hypothetical protein